MTIKPVVLQQRGVKDLEDITVYYRNEAGSSTAQKLIAAVQKAFRHLECAPGTGSQRYATAAQRPPLRFWKLTKFPHLVFYFEFETSVEVIRIISDRRNVRRCLHMP